MVKAKSTNKFLQILKERMGPLIAMAALLIIVSVSSKYFLTSKNITNVLRQICTTAMVTYGATICLISGNIDLSCGSTVALASVVLTILLRDTGIPFLAAFLIAVLAGGVVGLANGTIVSRTGLPPFIVTLGMQNVVRGVAYLICDGTSVRVENNALKNLGSGSLWIIPIPVIIVVVVTVICMIIMGRTRLGRNMFACGGNRDAARYSGIDTKNVTLWVYIIAGILAGIGGAILAGRVYSGQPTAGQGMEGDAISAAVLGGVAFSGGYGSIGAAVIGVLIIGIMNNALNLWELSSFWQLIVKGVILLVAVYADTLKKLRDSKA